MSFRKPIGLSLPIKQGLLMLFEELIHSLFSIDKEKNQRFQSSFYLNLALKAGVTYLTFGLKTEKAGLPNTCTHLSVFPMTLPNIVTKTDTYTYLSKSGDPVYPRVCSSQNLAYNFRQSRTQKWTENPEFQSSLTPVSVSSSPITVPTVPGNTK